MKRWKMAITLAAVFLALAGVVQARADHHERKYYVDEHYDDDYDEGRWALGIGFGFVELGDNVVDATGQVRLIADDVVEQYFTANLRFGFGDQYAHHRKRGCVNCGRFNGYLEPELGYWDSNVRGLDKSDLLLGVNIVGGMPLNAVEFFVGAGLGVHFIDQDIIVEQNGVATTSSESDTAIGANAHFGVDVSVSRKVSLFGVGRFDIVDDDRDEIEGKAYVGLRFRF